VQPGNTYRAERLLRKIKNELFFANKNSRKQGEKKN
jgi:hypothetical protein